MSRKIHILLLPRFNMFSLTNVIEPTRIANYLSDHDIYTLNFISRETGPVTASNGMSVLCEALPDRLERRSLLLVVGSWGSERFDDKRLFSWLRLQSRIGVQMCTVEQGTYMLAKSGLLRGKQATTHWSCIAGFQEQYPDIHVSEQLFTIEGNIMCCSGATAGIDFMLKFIGDEHGTALASEISNQMMHYPVRQGKEPQRKALGRGLEKLGPDVRAAVEVIEKHISDPLVVPEIAKKVGLSQRQLERQFAKSVGCSIVQFGLLLRLQHARVLLISTNLGVREIATASGFNSLSHFAYSFKKCFGRRPSTYRQAWPDQDETPHWPGTLGRFIETLKPSRMAKEASKGLDDGRAG